MRLAFVSKPLAQRLHLVACWIALQALGVAELVPAASAPLGHALKVLHRLNEEALIAVLKHVVGHLKSRLGAPA